MYSLGDRIVIEIAFVQSGSQIQKGWAGTIVFALVEADHPYQYGVEFDEECGFQGHSCGGICENGMNGFWINSDILERCSVYESFHTPTWTI
jgi:hypothetical protein